MEQKAINFHNAQKSKDAVAFCGVYSIHQVNSDFTKIGTTKRQIGVRCGELDRRHFKGLAGFTGGRKDARNAGYIDCKAVDLIPLPETMDITIIEKEIHRQLKQQGHKIVISDAAKNNNNSLSSEFYHFDTDTVTVTINGKPLVIKVR